ncbi:MAG: cytochrome c biosis protein CcmG, thiol:disulfide interchange protein DsbE [Gaiellaceae bacterium]|nr:cytochrome c biosis protein CcmG, thiol:disulfide interchange protein DsbE [Gaiellaceae bacterium]
MRLAAQTLAIAGVGVLAGLLLWRLTHQPAPPRVGERAPAFSLQRLNGAGTVSLASFRGKTVVLNFFASWCKPCKREAPVLEQLWRDYRSQGVVVLGIDTNDASSDARDFISAHGVTYPTVGGAGDALLSQYGIGNLPGTYVLNRQGRVVGGLILGAVSAEADSRALTGYLHAALKS